MSVKIICPYFITRIHILRPQPFQRPVDGD
jgi:hypothetical protein